MLSSTALKPSRNKLFAVLTALVMMAGVPWLSTATATASTNPNVVNVIIHYFRYDGNYSSWDNWIWENQSVSSNGNAYAFNGSDTFGQVANVQLPCPAVPCTQIGFIIREGGNAWTGREPPGNRYANVVNGKVEVWVVSGDRNNYYSLQAAQAAKAPHVSYSVMDGSNSVTAQTGQTQVTLGSGGSGFYVKDLTTGKTIPAVKAADAGNFPSGPGFHPTVAGDFQGSNTSCQDWDPGCSVTLMKQVSPDLYQLTLTLLPSNGNAGDGNSYYEYKVAMDPNWNCSSPQANVAMNVPSKETVTFWFVPSQSNCGGTDNGTTEGVYDSINNAGQPLPNGPGWKTNDVQLTLASSPSVSDNLVVGKSGLRPATVIPRDVLNLPQYTYTGNDLGATYSSTSTQFRVWTPVAQRVSLLLYKTETGGVTKTVPMTRSTEGTWLARVSGNLLNWYYVYQVSIDGQTNVAVDPYAQALSANAGRAMVVEASSINPSGWSSDTHVGVTNPVNASIYEVSVRDFSSDANSGVPSADRGRYLAFTLHGTTVPGTQVKTGLDSLMQLGVKDVELQPVQQFATLDQYKIPCPNVTQANAANPCYDWGYGPTNYDVPEAWYASTPHGTARISEFKQMVHAIHAAHMGVIMDVVYNHTFSTAAFDTLVPGYFYREDAAGDYTDPLGVGDEMATERPMVAKFMEDSMKFWVQQYHVDGFRIDSMALTGYNTLKKISSDLHKVDPGITILGEPWSEPGSALPAGQQVTASNEQGLGVGIFNASFRDAVMGDAGNEFTPGYATGSGNYSGVETGVVGSISSYPNGLGGFASQPSESINYVSVHDNFTLWDHLTSVNSVAFGMPLAQQEKMDELANAIVFTSQGVPFMQGGDEFLRTKQNNGNSYDAGDLINELDWSRKKTYAGVFNYYAGLNQLRNAHPAFRMTTAAEITKNLRFLNSNDNTVAFELNGGAVGDSWSHIVVMYNPNQGTESLTLPAGSWTIVGTQNKIGITPLGSASGHVSVPALSTQVLYQK